MNIPNTISILRFLIIPFYTYFILTDSPNKTGHIIATILFIVASISDIADGYIARRYNMMSYLGQFLDPMADKVMCITAFISLVKINKMNVILACIIISTMIMYAQFTIIEEKRNLTHRHNKFSKYSTIMQMLLIVVLSSDLFNHKIEFAISCVTLFFVVIAFIENMYLNRSVLVEGD